MIPGHTKFKCDGSFGLIKKLYRKTTVDCVNHIVEVVKKSSTAGLNKAQCYDNGKGFQYLGLNESIIKLFIFVLSRVYIMLNRLFISFILYYTCFLIGLDYCLFFFHILV